MSNGTKYAIRTLVRMTVGCLIILAIGAVAMAGLALVGGDPALMQP